MRGWRWDEWVEVGMRGRGGDGRAEVGMRGWRWE